jgi:hypothetical protein
MGNYVPQSTKADAVNMFANLIKAVFIDNWPFILAGIVIILIVAVLYKISKR